MEVDWRVLYLRQNQISRGISPAAGAVAVCALCRFIRFHVHCPTVIAFCATSCANLLPPGPWLRYDSDSLVGFFYSEMQPPRDSPLSAEIPHEHLLRTLRTDPAAAELLVTLYALAAFSPRFPSVLPVPPAYQSPSADCDIALLRADLLALPPLRSHPTSAPSWPATLEQPRLRALLQHILYPARPARPAAPYTPAPLLRSSDAAARLPESRGLRAARFTAQAPARASRPTRSLVAFHGTSSDRWYSLLRNGFRIEPPEPYNITNGRLYGDGAYLARSPRVALAFAPHARLPTRVPAVGLRGLTAVGHFLVDARLAAVGRGPSVGSATDPGAGLGSESAGDPAGEGTVEGATAGVPEGYVVVREELGLQLEAISVLMEYWPDSSAHMGALGRRPWWLHWVGRIYDSVGVFGMVLIMYAITLAIISFM